MTLDGKNILKKHINQSLLIRVSRNEEHIYLMHLRDAILLEWLGDRTTISIFKIHYDRIYENVLKHFGCAG